MSLRLKNKTILIFGAGLMLAIACEKKYFPKPPGPKTAAETSVLEASYVSTAPTGASDAYWKTADYLKVPVGDLSKNNLFQEGYLNMTATYGGIVSFNKGGDPKVVMKAAYDDNKVYVYVEWVDNTMDAGYLASILNGPSDPLKSDTTNGWTSQGNSDKVALAFDLSAASGTAGTFADKGCAASCHNNKMQPQSGSIDVWCWDLATSDPLGYANDLVSDDGKGLRKDTGLVSVNLNKKTPSGSHSAPLYEWNGSDQTVTRPDGKSVIVDPGYYLLSTNTVSFTGDYAKGLQAYNNHVYGCFHCHGENGSGVGPSGEATAFASVGFERKYSRTSLSTFAASDDHDGHTYWQQVPASFQNDLLAYIRGLGSVPGVYLTPPSGSTADIWTASNVARARINTTSAHTLYSVVFIRNLNTSHADDVQFVSPEGKSYTFGVALMNGDSKNHIGSQKQTLIFKSKQL